MSMDDYPDNELRRWLDGPVGPTAHLPGAARKLAARRRRRRLSVSSAAAVVLVAAALTLPSQPSGRDSIAPPLAEGGPRAADTDVEDVASALGLDALALASEHALLASECLQELGIDWRPSAGASDLRAGFVSLWFAPAGDRYGFGPGEAPAGADVPPPSGWEKAMYGEPRLEVTIAVENGAVGNGAVTVPVGGCHGRATEQLYGVEAEKFERAYLAVRPLADQAIDAAAGSGRVQAASRRWSACLVAAGWEGVSTPEELDNALTTEAAVSSSGDPSAVRDFAGRERALLAADRRCRAASGLQDAFDTAFVDLGARVVAANEGALGDFRGMLDHAASVVERRGVQASADAETR